jgi:hypothetical protein
MKPAALFVSFLFLGFAVLMFMLPNSQGAKDFLDNKPALFGLGSILTILGLTMTAKAVKMLMSTRASNKESAATNAAKRAAAETNPFLALFNPAPMEEILPKGFTGGLILLAIGLSFLGVGASMIAAGADEKFKGDMLEGDVFPYVIGSGFVLMSGGMGYMGMK